MDIPDCDLLIHAGDITMMGKPQALQSFNDWCQNLLEKKVVGKIIGIAGNHDFLFEREPDRARSLITGMEYLQDSGILWNGIRFWGTPWQPWFYDWAFNLHTEDELQEKFKKIPHGTDILISHGPPKGILDTTIRGDSVGSISLLRKIEEVRPKLVVFGHIHEGYGIEKRDGITYINASICDVQYKAVHSPILLEFPSEPTVATLRMSESGA